MIKQRWQQFKQDFFQKCCKLIYEAQPNDKPNYFSDKKCSNPEDWITYDYVEAIKKVDLIRGVRTCGSKQKSVNNTALKEPDITFSNYSNTLKTFFECKILGENSKYINKGIQRFVVEDYGFPDMSLYGMLGYVRDDNSATQRYIKLEKSIEKKKKEINLTNQSLVKDAKNEVIFKTEHKTDKSKANKEILITHILHSWD